MRYPCIVLATAATFAWSGTLLAQTATTPPPTTTTTTTTTTGTTTTGTTTTVSNAGAYDKLSEGNKKIVSAIYEAQLGSPNDTTQGQLLTRDDIAAMRQDTGWGNVYRQLQQQGLVTEKNLGQAISSHNHSTNAGSSVTVISTAGGEQITVGKGKSGSDTASSVKSGHGNSAAAKADNGKSTVVTTAAGSTAGAAAAASNAGGVRAGGNGNGQGSGKVK